MYGYYYILNRIEVFPNIVEIFNRKMEILISIQRISRGIESLRFYYLKKLLN